MGKYEVQRMDWVPYAVVLDKTGRRAVARIFVYRDGRKWAYSTCMGGVGKGISFKTCLREISAQLFERGPQGEYLDYFEIEKNRFNWGVKDVDGWGTEDFDLGKWYKRNARGQV